VNQELVILRQVLEPLKKSWFGGGLDFKDAQDDKRNALSQSGWEMVWFNPKFYRFVMIAVPSINILLSLSVGLLVILKGFSSWWLIPLLFILLGSARNLYNYLKTHTMIKYMRVNFYDILLREEE